MINQAKKSVATTSLPYTTEKGEVIDLNLNSYINPNNNRVPFSDDFSKYTTENFTCARAISTFLAVEDMNDWGGMIAYHLNCLKAIQLLLDSPDLPDWWSDDMPDIKRLIELFELLNKPGIEDLIEAEMAYTRYMELTNNRK